jgi:hypothetical protein
MKQSSTFRCYWKQKHGNFFIKIKIVCPRAGCEGPEEEYRYGFTLALTSALDAGGWLTPQPSSFIPRKETQYPLYRSVGGPQDRSGQVQKISPNPGFDPRIVLLVASHYTDWAILANFYKDPNHIFNSFLCTFVNIFQTSFLVKYKSIEERIWLE